MNNHAFTFTLSDAKYGNRQHLEQEYQARLSVVPYADRLFDLSGPNKDLLNDWRDGAMETDALLGAGTWGPEVWPHMGDDAGVYSVASASACRAWALGLFIVYAGIYKARNDHLAAIEAQTDAEIARLYDVTTGWPV